MDNEKKWMIQNKDIFPQKIYIHKALKTRNIGTDKNYISRIPILYFSIDIAKLPCWDIFF